MKAGSRVFLDGSPGKVGTVLIVRDSQAKVIWPSYESRWHDCETLRIVPADSTELKEKKP